jgi:DedD protein
MAFFNFRLPGQSASNAVSESMHTTPAESLEVLRKRARHRLIGSVVLVLAAVIGFPLLFDTQPRPVSVDTPIVIPERRAAVVASAPAQGALPPAGVLDANEEVVMATPRPADPPARSVDVPAPAASPVITGSANPGGFKVEFGKTGNAVPPAEAVSQRKPEPKPEPKPLAETPAELKPTERKPEAKAEGKVETKVAVDKPRDEAAKARALLEGKDPSKTSDERLVIQVGAYNDAVKVREARQKLEAAGFKTYTQVIDGKDGKRTRVRVGPFDSKAEADKSAQKIRKLQLEAVILKL